MVLLRMNLFVFLEILGSLERFLAYLQAVRRGAMSKQGGSIPRTSEASVGYALPNKCQTKLPRSFEHTSEMAGNMVPFSARCPAVFPLACETEVIGALSTNVLVAKVVVELLWVTKRLGTFLPETPVSRCRLRICWRRGSGGHGGWRKG